MLRLVENYLEIRPTTSNVNYQLSHLSITEYSFENEEFDFFILLQGNRRPFVMGTVKADDDAKLGMHNIHYVM